MRRLLRIAAAAIVVCVLVVWAGTGAHRSWTQTQVEIKTVDPVTGLVGTDWKPTFVPGADFVAVGIVAGALVAGASFFFEKKKVGNGR